MTLAHLGPNCWIFLQMPLEHRTFLMGTMVILLNLPDFVSIAFYVKLRRRVRSNAIAPAAALTERGSSAYPHKAL